MDAEYSGRECRGAKSANERTRERSICNELIRGRAFSTTLRKPKGTVFDPKRIEQLDYMNLHAIT
jgi:hypothetical protein